MDPIVTNFISNVASGLFVNFATDAVKQLFAAAIDLKPALSDEINSAQTNQDVERIFHEAVGVIDANASTGSISVDGSLLDALRGIRFDHARGKVTIGNSVISAPVLVTGGSAGATGQTVVGGNTRLKSQGTEIKVGKGAGIKMTGGASIKQT